MPLPGLSGLRFSLDISGLPPHVRLYSCVAFSRDPESKQNRMPSPRADLFSLPPFPLTIGMHSDFFAQIGSREVNFFPNSYFRPTFHRKVDEGVLPNVTSCVSRCCDISRFSSFLKPRLVLFLSRPRAPLYDLVLYTVQPKKNPFHSTYIVHRHSPHVANIQFHRSSSLPDPYPPPRQQELPLFLAAEPVLLR